jgi:hypothetical protein
MRTEQQGCDSYFEQLKLPETASFVWSVRAVNDPCVRDLFSETDGPGLFAVSALPAAWKSSFVTRWWLVETSRKKNGAVGALAWLPEVT